MQITNLQQLVRIQAKGLITLPKKFRQDLGLQENQLARIKKIKGRLIIEPVRILPYPTRSYTDQDLTEFLKLDRRETKQLKKKRLL